MRSKSSLLLAALLLGASLAASAAPAPISTGSPLAVAVAIGPILPAEEPSPAVELDRYFQSKSSLTCFEKACTISHQKCLTTCPPGKGSCEPICV
jgi:hypothetical protein